MHNIQIPQDLVDRVVARMGDRHSCKSLEPSATTLLVIDMQNYFVMEGQEGECPIAREIVGFEYCAWQDLNLRPSGYEPQVKTVKS